MELKNKIIDISQLSSREFMQLQLILFNRYCCQWHSAGKMIYDNSKSNMKYVEINSINSMIFSSSNAFSKYEVLDAKEILKELKWRNVYVRIKNTIESDKVQEKLFEDGCYWNGVFGTEVFKTKETHRPLLFVGKQGEITYGNHIPSDGVLAEDVTYGRREVSVDEILGTMNKDIELKEGCIFENSQGNTTVIYKVGRNNCYLASERGSKWEVSKIQFKKRIETGHYTALEYKPAKAAKTLKDWFDDEVFNPGEHPGVCSGMNNLIESLLKKEKKEKPKTLRDWLGLIGDDKIRRQAQSNAYINKLDDKFLSMAQAIIMAFDWSDTPEGHDYWNEICDKFKRNMNYIGDIEKKWIEVSGDNFPVNSTSEQRRIKDSINKAQVWGSSLANSITPGASKIGKSNINILINQNQLQNGKGKITKTNRPVSRITRGERPGGNEIRSRARKATIESRPLSYRASVIRS